MVRKIVLDSESHQYNTLLQVQLRIETDRYRLVQGKSLLFSAKQKPISIKTIIARFSSQNTSAASIKIVKTSSAVKNISMKTPCTIDVLPEIWCELVLFNPHVDFVSAYLTAQRRSDF